MKTPPLARLGELIRSLEGTNWITSRQVLELKEIHRELGKLRQMSDRTRIAIFQILRSIKIHENGRVQVMQAMDFYSAIGELNSIIEEIRPKATDE